MWKDVEGFDGLYMVNELGEVYSSRRGRILRPMISSRGYRCVKLHNKGKSLFAKIARLVGTAFVSNPNNYPHINHKDGVKINDVYTNLEWCTPSQNMNHAIALGLTRHGENHRQSKLTTQNVIDIRQEAKDGKKYRELSNKYGVAFETISAIVRFKQRKLG